ncbi:MAG: hypothetical protein NVV68_06760 [Dokdonella sp.]|nr:hypothetical protein [Dokdonella sp.]
MGGVDAVERSARVSQFAIKMNLDPIRRMAGEVAATMSRVDNAQRLAMSGLKRRALPVARRAIQENYNVKTLALRDARGNAGIRVETGGRGRKSDYLAIWASTRSIPLIAFSGKWGGVKTPGATASIEQGAGAKTYEGAFISTVEGLRSIRKRRLGVGSKRVPRGPLIMLRGPSPFDMMAPQGNHPAALRTQRTIIAELTDWYVAELKRQIARGQ